MSPSPHTSSSFSSHGVRIHFRLFGSSGLLPVVIVHGLSFFSYDWIDAAYALSSDRQVAAMDMRGFGDSESSSDYSLQAFAADIIALLDHLNWGRAILIGHSMGGRNCTYCAAEYPNRIAGLVLVDWSPEPAAAGSKRVAESVANMPDVFATIEEAMRYFKVDPNSEAGSRKRERFEAYLRPVPGGFVVKRDTHFRDEFRKRLDGKGSGAGVDLWAALKKVKAPIMVIRGTRSDLFASETVPKMKTAHPKLELVEVDAGHNVVGDNLDQFVKHTRSFLEEEYA